MKESLALIAKWAAAKAVNIAKNLRPRRAKP
jgi:hypothetical protein